MSAVEDDPGWYERMAQRTVERRMVAQAEQFANEGRASPPRSTWPQSLPEQVRAGASGRDALLWYIADGWQRIFGGEVETLLDHDFGYHVLRNDMWQITLVNVEQFPDQAFPEEE